ncbi:MAG: CRISPR-associated endonuclease Cas2, partial [bacterium]|nr:CRISPR-associated endonuclease Cas2 [bacterium]
LSELYFVDAALGEERSGRGVYRALWEADKTLSQFSYQTIKQELAYLRRKGLVRLTKEPEITEAGRKRLSENLPFYDEKRAWDGSVYLVAYDIDEKRNYQRDKLRNFLKRLGAGLLQESVWLAIYNPETLLKEFMREEDISANVLVSCLGKDGYVGEGSLRELLAEVFGLWEINERYREFIYKFSSKKFPDKDKINSCLSAGRFVFLSILKDDPQLPFELLPKEWAGDKANVLYGKLFLER